MITLALTPLALLGGFGRRFAGGVWEDWTGVKSPGFLSKVFYGFSVAFLAGLGALLSGGLSWLVVAFCAVLGVNVFVGHVVLGLWGGSSRMGRRGDHNELFSWPAFVRDALGMTGYGLGHVFLAVGLAWWIAHPWLTPGVGPLWDAGREHVYRWWLLALSALGWPISYTVTWLLAERNAVPFVRGVTWDGRSALPSPLQMGEWAGGTCLGLAALWCIG